MGRKNWIRRQDGKETFHALSEFLSKGRNKEDRPYSGNTRIEKTGLGISIVLHGTRVITFFPGGEFWLNSGGWRTMTTKERINEFLPLGWQLFQDKGIWYISKGDRWDSKERMVFFDNIKLPRQFKIIDPRHPTVHEKKIKSLIGKIDRYCKKLREKISSFEIEDPSGGDCWFCLMKTDEGKSLGDVTNNTEHLLSHLKENYFVPSLILNAIEDSGFNAHFIWSMYHHDREKFRKGEIVHDTYYGTTFSRAVRRYLKRKLGVAQ